MLKKILIGLLLLILIGCGVFVYRLSQNTYENKIEEIKEKEPAIKVESNLNNSAVSLNIYSDDENPEEIKSFYLDVDTENLGIDEKKLSLLETGSKAISGLDVYSDDGVVHVVVDKEELNDDIINLVDKLGVVDKELLTKVQEVLEMNKDELIDFLAQNGLGK